MDEAVACITERRVLQPCLFKVNGLTYVKLHNRSVSLHNASCFIEAVELLLMCFWVFNVEYPAQLRLFYAFLEETVGVRSSKPQAPTLRDFHRELAALN